MGIYSTTGGEGTGKPFSEKTKEKFKKIRNTKRYHLEQSKRMKMYYNSPEGKRKQKERWFLTQTPKIKEKIKQKLKQQRSNPLYKLAKMKEQKEIWANPKLREKHSKLMKQTHSKKGYREQMSISVKKSWIKRRQSKIIFHRSKR